MIQPTEQLLNQLIEQAAAQLAEQLAELIALKLKEQLLAQLRDELLHRLKEKLLKHSSVRRGKSDKSHSNHDKLPWLLSDCHPRSTLTMAKEVLAGLFTRRRSSLYLRTRVTLINGPPIVSRVG